MKNVSVVFILAAFLLCSGCASIVSKTRYPVSINSEPSGANVKIVDKKGREVFRDVTPASVMLKSGAGFFSKASYLATIEMEGFETRTIPIEFTFDGWYVGNILFGGLIGLLIVDPATGAMWRIKTELVDVTLQQSMVAGVNPDKKDPSLMIRLIDEIPEHWKDQLIPLQ